MEDYKKTEQKLSELAAKFTEDLKSILRKENHKESGDLERSIKFSFKKEGESYVLKLSANSYIKYLDDGELLPNFMKTIQKEISTAVAKTMKEDVINQIKNIQ